MIGKKPKISVVITTFSDPVRLRGALETVKKQTLRDIEILVLDGANSECCKVVAEEFSARFIGIENDAGPPHGVQDARNLGFKEAKADVIAFLDDDDRWDETKLEKQYKIIESDRNVVMVSSYLLFKSDTSEYIEKKKEKPTFTDLLRGFAISSTSSLMIRKEALYEVNGWRHTRGMQEYDLALRIAKLGYDIVCVQEPLMIQSEMRLGGVYWKVAEQFEFFNLYGADLLKYLGWKVAMQKAIKMWFTIVLYITIKDKAYKLLSLGKKVGYGFA